MPKKPDLSLAQQFLQSVTSLLRDFEPIRARRRREKIKTLSKKTQKQDQQRWQRRQFSRVIKKELADGTKFPGTIFQQR